MTEFRFGKWRFKFRLPMALAALVGIAIAISLGNWQTRRAEARLGIQKMLDDRASGPVLSIGQDLAVAADVQYARISVLGEFLPRHTVYLDNRIVKGAPGYQVVTPLRIVGGDMCILVNRGWVPLGRSRAELPPVPTPAGEVALTGVAFVPPARVYELASEQDPGPIVQHLNVDTMAKRTGLRLQPIVMQQTGGTADGLVREWVRPDAGADTNRAYALQWYALGLLIAILYLTLNMRRRSE